MESTGEYWRPIYNVLEAAFELILVNAKHVKAVPGRKTDVKDAQWLAELMQHGLLKASFVPPTQQRDLRDLCRHRSNFIRERASIVNRIHKLLETTNIKMQTVATDVMGVSGRTMLDALVRGETDPLLMAAFARGRMKSKKEELEQALMGRVREHHRIILKELLHQIDSLDASIGRLDEAIKEACTPFEPVVKRLDTLPGVARRTAETIVSEIGTDMSRFPSAAHLCAWAGVAPGNNESAGKRLSTKARKGNITLRSALVLAAHAAARQSDTFLSSQYHRIAARRGRKRAILAVAHSILVIAYHMIERSQDYQELGATFCDQRKPEATARRLVSRLKQIGYDVTLNASSAPAAA
jgi:transposase